ncbi:sensor histidine kinase [Microcoleus sp. FACHB-1515]|uniref:sensor histidine kinase n=1 Tax=Cyanophyceae TaxID=3028117 RepID=UPI001681F363|nr:ATP-binding protein [Microcoleus sp. FACHB-1515]MBD2092689.1 sensor histidine kinase [Microcoleus sp. FACHB-1515]
MPPLRSNILPPLTDEASSQPLNLDSTLAALTLHQFEVESTCNGREIARLFEQYPAIPGVIVTTQGKFCGMISRSRWLEFFLRPGGIEMALMQPIAVLHSYARRSSLIVPHTMPILAAAQRALRRDRDQQAEPILVQFDAQTFRLLDVHELNIAHWMLRGIEMQVRCERMQMQMIQIEKMASLGRLVDGVAHEILDPVGFIWGNLTHVSSYVEQLLQLVQAYEQAKLPEAIAQLREAIELDYLRQDLPRSIASIKTGADRLKILAASLQNFCHVDEVYPKPADLHDCLDSILLLLKSRLSGSIHVVKNYSHLPPVTCYAGQLSQVFINILIHTIELLLNQAVQRDIGTTMSSFPLPSDSPQITITTQVCCLERDRLSNSNKRWISIRIANNGTELTPAQHQQILNSFSIEQRAAKETSLALSYQIVTAKHGGQLRLNDRGKEFEILLPLT